MLNKNQSHYIYIFSNRRHEADRHYTETLVWRGKLLLSSTHIGFLSL